MDKRLFSAIPRPEVEKRFLRLIKIVPQMTYLVTASRQKIGGKDTLIVNFFKNDENEIVPVFRTFCQEDDYISQDLLTEKTVWRTGSIQFLIYSFYSYGKKMTIATATLKDRETILKFIKKYEKRIRPFTEKMAIQDFLEEYQDRIKDQRLQKRYAKEMAEIDGQMEKFGSLPDDYQEFVENTVFADENYIFYNRKKAKAFCTGCKHEFELEKGGYVSGEKEGQHLKHNSQSQCPHCGRTFQCRSEGMGRKKLFAIQWSVLVQKYEEEVLVRYFCHTKDFRSDFKNPIIKSFEKTRTIHTAEGDKDFEWNYFKRSGEIRWCYYKDPVWTWPSAMDVPRNAILYNTDLKKTISGTCMQYSAVDIYIDKIFGGGRPLREPWCIDWYFNAYRKMPYLEQLLKVGFIKMVREILENSKKSPLKSGRTILEILSLNKEEFNMLRRLKEPSLRDRAILACARETLGRISERDFLSLHNIPDSRYQKFYQKYIALMQHTTLYKIQRYLKRQEIDDVSLYFDYTDWLEEMGYDMKNKSNLYPKSFMKAHDKKSEEYTSFKTKKNQEQRKQFDKLLDRLHKENGLAESLKLHNNGFLIRLPHILDEIRREGEALGHCVATYVDKVAERKTLIFFIRRESEPDKPFFTLEWKGAVIQYYGYRHCKPTPELNKFIRLFSRKMDEYTKVPNALWDAA